MFAQLFALYIWLFGFSLSLLIDILRIEIFDSQKLMNNKKRSMMCLHIMELCRLLINLEN